MASLCSRVRRSRWILWIVGGSLLLVQGVISLDWGYRFSLRRIWVLFFPCFVLVDPIITAASCGFDHASGLVLELSGRLV
ncbi:hypothetical protein F2Q68_00035157 [Brassica cretica]|uniref:Uncharacterized protein n=1 Tax=Brassica cretica TaxID=69181 RepID=A0A8S9HAA3_BRACR|nr:hypothetical protein F2Q68_00035157 [Brassica cretica]